MICFYVARPVPFRLSPDCASPRAGCVLGSPGITGQCLKKALAELQRSQQIIRCPWFHPLGPPGIFWQPQLPFSQVRNSVWGEIHPSAPSAKVRGREGREAPRRGRSMPWNHPRCWGTAAILMWGQSEPCCFRNRPVSEDSWNSQKEFPKEA